MIHVILCDRYVAAVTDSIEQLSAWIKVHPLPADMRIERLAYGYPFIAFECNEDDWRTRMADGRFSFFPGDYPETNPEGFRHFKNLSPLHTIFTFSGNWQGQPDWADQMGILSHEHFGDDEY